MSSTLSAVTFESFMIWVDRTQLIFFNYSPEPAECKLPPKMEFDEDISSEMEFDEDSDETPRFIEDAAD